MSPSKDYFVKHWTLNQGLDIFQIINFHDDVKLFAWIQEHKGEKFSVYKATILLDFS